MRRISYLPGTNIIFAQTGWLAVLLDVSAIIHPLSTTLVLFVPNLQKSYYGRPHIIERIRCLFSREDRKGFVSNMSGPLLSDKPWWTVSHGKSNEAAAFFVAKTKSVRTLRVGHAWCNPRDVTAEYFHGAFPPGEGRERVRCFIADAGEPCKFMEILDTYWIKVVLWDEQGRVALPNIRRI